MRPATNHYEMVKNFDRLLKIEARVNMDYQRALERSDIVRGLRHAKRISMIDNRICNNAPFSVSPYSDMDSAT
jgi:hypothetical protein